MEETLLDIDLKDREEYIINMGPQHPSTHGVLRFETCLQGEMVKYIIPHCGYIHRGIEKMSESLSYPQLVHLTDRMDYLSAHMNNEAVALCVEKAMEVEVTDRVKYIRTILAELSRIASHQLWWSAFGMDLGALTTFFYGLRDRERILDIFEETTGTRLIQTFITPGGLMNDVHPNFQKRVREFVTYFRKKLPEYNQLLTGNVIFQERTKGIGYMSKEVAISYGVTGPSGRGSGFHCDIRKLAPYSAYPFVKFNEITATEGDTFARYWVRMQEMSESLDIIDQLVDNIPQGDYMLALKAIKAPKGEFYHSVETARGELGVFIVSDGGPNPARIKYRTPNFSNLFVINKIAAGHKIADLVAISGSLDLVIPDIDR
ncbi:MAG: NADH-quinone oxidoreductase subunit D [Cyclobacteriaceae bacterium]|nr:NADH-quinone oxidoreductase subunit D [Cyclobacteriaceae bacterium]